MLPSDCSTNFELAAVAQFDLHVRLILGDGRIACRRRQLSHA